MPGDRLRPLDLKVAKKASGSGDGGAATGESAPLSMRPQEGELATPTLNNVPSRKEPGGAVLTPRALLAFRLPPSLHALVSSVLHNGML